MPRTLVLLLELRQLLGCRLRRGRISLYRSCLTIRDLTHVDVQRQRLGQIVRIPSCLAMTLPATVTLMVKTPCGSVA